MMVNLHRYAWMLYLLSLILSGCSIMDPIRGKHTYLQQQVAEWVERNVLDWESIAVPAVYSEHMTRSDIFIIPNDSQTFSILGLLEQESPDFFIAPNSIAWEGVRHQPWFQLRYEPFQTLLDTEDSTSPVVIYGHTPTPFDAGELVYTQHAFNDEGPGLSGYKISSTRVLPGKDFYLTIFWQVSSLAHSPSLELILSLKSKTKDHDWALQAMTFDPDYETFCESTYIKTYHHLTTPAHLEPGAYNLNVELQKQNGEPLAVIQNGEESKNDIHLTTLQLPQMIGADEILPQNLTNYTFREDGKAVIVLKGYDMVPLPDEQGNISIALVWFVREKPSGDYKVFLHIRDSANNVIAQIDGKPVGWSYPTQQWHAGEYIFDTYTVNIDTPVQRGKYALFTGLYDAVSGDRLPVEDGTSHPLAQNEIYLTDIALR
ncbi:MAG: hypothetical protein P1S60_13050 [Anaerolineae bacterium]|nr:hypothetical protein [Anaerolineae bacterium]